MKFSLYKGSMEGVNMRSHPVKNEINLQLYISF